MKKKDTNKLSTNEKLSMLANAREDDTLVEEHYQEEESKAHDRLRRSVLYGQGSRAKIPKVRKVHVDAQSPYALMAQMDPSQPDTIHTSYQPGAHEDAYRIVQYGTTKNRNDPDRVFFTTTRFSEGVKFSHQGPWYCGYDNKTKPPDGNLLTAAARYGYRGSKEINQKHTLPHENPTRTRNAHTPKFLTGNEVVDEWVPPILATKFQTVNNMESPKLWPSSTEYVTGFPKKKLPTETMYNRETTVGMDSRPQTADSLEAWFDKTANFTGTLHDYAMMERSNTLLSLPMERQMQCEAEWKDRVSKTASSALRKTMREENPPHSPQMLSDPSDSIRYSGPTAVITHTMSTDEFKFRMRMQHSNSVINYDLKWKQIFMIFRHLKMKIKRDMSMTLAIRDVGNALRREGILAGTPTSLTRKQFLDCLTKYKYFETLEVRSLSGVYSSLDPLKRNSVRFIELLDGMALIDLHLDKPAEKLGCIWNLHSDYGDDEPPFDVALAVLCSANYNDVDRRSIEKMYKDQFRPTCFKVALSVDTRDSSSMLTSLAALAQKGRKDEAADGSVTSPGASRPPTSGSGTGRSQMYRNKSASGHPFNICDKFFCRETFVSAVERCPALLENFDQQLSFLLVQFYGKDARYVVEADVSVAAEEKDFSWILSRKG